METICGPSIAVKDHSYGPQKGTDDLETIGPSIAVKAMDGP